MTDITKYAHILQALGEGKTVQSVNYGVWVDSAPNSILRFIADGGPAEAFRIAPSTVTLTYDIPKPMMERPKDLECYWFVSGCDVGSYRWQGDITDQKLFASGIYATLEDAQAAADAHKAAMAALGVK